ncbi:MAG: hypothetical protein H6742_20065 [Alphaproteobacteria bacterium]|nr:hypothetical protein [Alphaproteobacteria bacterium]
MRLPLVPSLLSLFLALSLACGGAAEEDAAPPSFPAASSAPRPPDSGVEEGAAVGAPAPSREASPDLAIVKGAAGAGAELAEAEPPDGTPPSPEPTDAVDWFESLPDSAIQYNRPERVPFGGSFEIGLVIDLSGDADAAAAALDALRRDHPDMVGATRAVAAPTGDEVEVLLLGSNALIEPLEPARQRISRRRPATWRWSITPAGPHDVELNLSVLAIEPGHASGTKIESYSDTIVVEVTTAQRAQLWLADNWEWAWTFLGAPLLALGWSIVRKRRKGAPSDG